MSPGAPIGRGPAKSRTTLKDIAAQLGVSAMTVSMALRDDPQIPPATRERVRQAAKALCYVPQDSARRLRTGRSGRIAYVAARLAHAFVGELLVGIEARARETGRFHNRILPFSTWYHIDEREAVLRDILYGGQADAVVLASMHPSPELVQEYGRHGVPLVLIEDQAAGCASVRVDNVLGARLAVQHLVKQGCRHVGLLSGELPPDGIELNPTTVERRQGFQKALLEAGRAFRPELVADVRFFRFEEGMAGLAALLQAEPGLDGIFCAAGDRVAMGVMQGARERGLKLPQDLRLIGYDDLPSSGLLDPPLSSVRQDAEQMGALALDLAVEALDHPGQAPREIILQPQLMVRQTA
jgi:DNA-binding LacI/PurR family transcriptional regulator